MNKGTSSFNLSPTQIQPIDGIGGVSSAAPAFEPLNSASKDAIQTVKLKPHKGTTSLGFRCKEGIILASCSPASTGTLNVMEIDRYMLCTMVGEPVDKLFWKQCSLYKSRNKQRMPVDLASEIYADMIDFFSEEENWVGAIIAGWDVHGPVLFGVDYGVGCTSGYSFVVGSGSSYVDAAMVAGLHRDVMADEAASFARSTILRLAFQDGVADRVAMVYYVGPQGWELMAYDDAGNPGPYYPIPLNSVVQEMTEDQEMTEEDARWLKSLESIERQRDRDQFLRGVCMTYRRPFLLSIT